MKKSLKRLLSLALCAALLFGLTPLNGIVPSIPSLFASTAAAANGTCGDDLTWSFANGSLTISGSGEMYNYGSNMGLTIAPWRDYCDSIIGVTVSSGVTTIGDYAFYGVSTLRSAILSTSVTSIGDHAFYGTGIVNLPDLSNVTKIGNSAFENCYDLSNGSLSTAASLTEIGDSAFKGCIRLNNLRLPNGLKAIGADSFRGCNKLTNIIFPAGLEEIGSGAFYGTGMNNFDLPDGLTSIGAEAFAGTPFYTSANWSNGVLYCGDYLLKVKDGLSIMQQALIADYTVWDDTRLIADEAFSGFTALRILRVPGSVRYIGADAFAGCTGITDVYYSGTQSDWDAIDIGSGNEKLLAANIHVVVPHVHDYSVEVIAEPTCTQPGEKVYTCAGCGNTYTEYPPATGHSDADGDDYCDVCGSYMITSGVCGDDLTWYYDEINDNLIIAGTGPMYDCKDNVPWAGWRDRVRTLSLESLTYIGEQAFSFCSVLTDVVIPDTVTEIGAEAFAACVSLRNVEIPDSVERIGDAAFVECFSLKSMVIPDGVERIESATFAGCVSLEYLTIPKSVSYIGEEAFVMLDAETVSELLAAIAQAQSQGETTLFGMPIDVLAAAFEHPEGMLSQVVYSGTQEEWDAIEIETGNDALLNADIIVHTHVYTSSEVIREPSCTQTGITIDSCACGYKNTWASNALPHTDANDDGICDVCGNITVTSGSCGTSLNWSYDVDTATLTFTGSGRMNDFNANTVPWRGYRGAIRRILFNGTDISYVGRNAFLNCTALEKAAFPASVTELGNEVFKGCVFLKSAVLLGAVRSLPTGLFEDCTALETVTLAEGTGDFNQRAFGNCKSLKTLVIPSSTQRIYANAFIGSGFEEIYIPDTVFMVAQYAFSGCDNLRKVRLTENTRYTAIDKNTFYGCSSLTDIVIPENVKTISDQAFFGCSALPEINIPASVTVIGNDVFNGCTGVTSITVDPSNTTFSSPGNCLVRTGTKTLIFGCMNSVIPDDGTVTRIGAEAFKGCVGLTAINIPYSVTGIGSKAFAGCTGLESIDYRARSVSDLSASSDVFFNAGNSGNGIAVVFDDTVSNIPAYLFSVSDAEGNPNVKSVVIGRNCYTIGAYAFSGCTRMTDLTIDSSIISVNESSNIFYDAGVDGDGISVTFGDDVTKVAQYLFATEEGEHIPNIISVDFGSSVETIGMRSFNHLQKIKSLDLPDSLVTIEQYAFIGCVGLEELTLGNSLETIGDSAFSDCYLLECVCLPDSVTSIGEAAFSQCLSLTDVNIPDGVTSIGIDAFALCTSLTEITIPSSVTSIATGTFAYCAGITKVTIPDSVTNIGVSAFHLSLDQDLVDGLRAAYDLAVAAGETTYAGISIEVLADIIANPDSSLTDVYYSGTSDDWNAIVIGDNNDDLLAATIHVHEHEYVSEITTPATCVAEGVMTFVCACGDSYTEVIPKTAHTDADFDGVCDACGGDPSDLIVAVEKTIEIAEGANVSLRFVPQVSGTYTLISYDGTGDADPICVLTDKDSDELTHDNDGNGNHDFALKYELFKGRTYFFICGDYHGSAVSCKVLLTLDSVLAPLEAAEGSGAIIDDDNGLIYGIAPNMTDLGAYIAAKQGYTYDSTASNTSGDDDIFSTGSVVTVYKDDIAVAEYALVLFGDVDGDGKYDGFDAYLVSCLDCGALTADDLSAASLAAADCNHDGAINGYDVNILVRAGILLGEVNQTGTPANDLGNDSAYIEYLELIEQAPAAEIDSEADGETEQISQQPATQKTSLIQRILDIIRTVLSFIRELFF